MVVNGSYRFAMGDNGQWLFDIGDIGNVKLHLSVNSRYLLLTPFSYKNLNPAALARQRALRLRRGYCRCRCPT